MALGWLWWRASVPCVTVDAAAVCVAGVALGPVCRRARRGFCVAGVALGDVHSARQAWDLWRRAGSGGTLGSPCRRARRGCLCGRRGTWRHPVSFGAAGVASVALGFIEVHFVWQPWHLALAPWTPRLFVWQAWHLATSSVIGVAGVALGDIDIHFVWQASDLATSTVTLHGRGGT